MEFEKLQKIIADALNVDPAKITMDTKFVDDLGADSLDLFQVIMEIEKQFEVTIDDVRIEKIVTVADAVEEIKNTLK
jgi:acyl carrier protein